MMRYYIWERESGRLLAICSTKQAAYDFLAIECTKIGLPKAAFHITYE